MRGPPKQKEVRYLDINENDELDEAQLATWVKQASLLPRQTDVSYQRAMRVGVSGPPRHQAAVQLHEEHQQQIKSKLGVLGSLLATSWARL